MDQFANYANLINATSAANNAWSAEQAQKQMEFQERLSSSAHQREVKDLVAAGLNPVLSSHGSGASTPSGAMADTDSSNTAALMQLLNKSIDAQMVAAKSAATAARASSGANYGKTGYKDWDQLLTDAGLGFLGSFLNNLGVTFDNLNEVPGKTGDYLGDIVSPYLINLARRYGINLPTSDTGTSTNYSNSSSSGKSTDIDYSKYHSSGSGRGGSNLTTQLTTDPIGFLSYQAKKLIANEKGFWNNVATSAKGSYNKLKNFLLGKS